MTRIQRVFLGELQKEVAKKEVKVGGGCVLRVGFGRAIDAECRRRRHRKPTAVAALAGDLENHLYRVST